MTDAFLAGTLPVRALAFQALNAVRDVVQRSTGHTMAPLDAERVAAAFTSDQVFTHDGIAPVTFAPASGFFRTRDGWVRTHANYPHHRDRLLGLLGLPATAGHDDVASALEVWAAQEVEDQAHNAGAIAVRVRGPAEWARSAPGLASASGPLVRHNLRRDTPVQSPAPATRAVDEAPLAGLRVLDLTRVIAGPVATRTLALLGADVLRVDDPNLPEIGWQHLDTGQGKRSTLLDLREPDHLATAQNLLADADVLVSGYRPGAVEQLGLRLRPGLVCARVSAWSGQEPGPWDARRGFDSIVQAASGIAMVESLDGRSPGRLPAQALDHCAGYLLAAGVVDALAARDGRGRDVSVSLSRVAVELLTMPGRTADHGRSTTPDPAAQETTYGLAGAVTSARPPFTDLQYRAPATPWGSDAATWQPGTTTLWP